MHVAVFCGASLGKSDHYAAMTQQLGQWLGEKKYTLVYGGAQVGLMGIIANQVLKHGGKVIGIIPRFLINKEIAHQKLNKMIVTKTMSERKELMSELSRIFIALPGGPGTLEEVADIISWIRVDQITGICIIFNIDYYYEPLKLMYDNMINEGFLSQKDREKIIFVNHLQELIMTIEQYSEGVHNHDIF